MTNGPSAERPRELPGEAPSLAAVAADVVVTVGGDGRVRSLDGWNLAAGGAVAELAVGAAVAPVLTGPLAPVGAALRRVLGPAPSASETVVVAAPAVDRAIDPGTDPGAAPDDDPGEVVGPGTWTEWTVRPFADGAVLLGSDVTATQAELARLGRLADLISGPVTGLGGRVAFAARLGERLAGPDPVAVGLVVVHLDRFRDLGLAHGWRGRAQVLAVLADRLALVVPPGSLLTQPSDDTFIVATVTPLAPGSGPDTGPVARRAEAIRVSVSRPVVLDTAGLVVTASVGHATGRSGDDVETLLHDAELAAVAAAADGGDRVLSASDDRRQLSLWRHELEQTLRRALADDGFRVLYQPEIALDTGRLIGAEALLRWDHEPWRDRSPSEVVALAERVGLIGLLGEWVLRRACTEAAAWPLPAGPAPYVAVNVSGMQLADPRFVDAVGAALDASGLAPQRLCLEVTETMVLADRDAVRSRLLALKALGVSIALDDFGTGYAGLDQLTDLPFDIVKLDARFVAGMAADPSRLAVVETVVALADRLGMRVIAEGVEVATDGDTLARLGYHAVQGYATGAPEDSASLVRELWRRAELAPDDPSSPSSPPAQSNDVTQT